MKRTPNGNIGRKSKWIYPYYVPDGKKLPIEEAISDAGSVILVESMGSPKFTSE